jgi:Zn-dependent protease
MPRPTAFHGGGARPAVRCRLSVGVVAGGTACGKVRSIYGMVDQPDEAGPNTPGGAGPAGQRQGGRPPGLLIARIRGFPVYLSPLVLVFALLIASMVVRRDRQQLPNASDAQIFSLAAITSVGFVLSLLLHEIGHALTALGLGLRVRAVTIHGFAGFTEIDPEPPTAGRELLVGVSGPLVNGLLAGLCFLGKANTSGDGQLGVLLFDMTIVNLALCVLNLAPGLPLDGGRLVVATVWGATGNKLRGLRAGAYGGFVVAAALAGWGLFLLPGGTGAFWTLGLAAFLAFGAHQSLRSVQLRERLPGLSAGRLVRKTLPVEGAVPLAEALRRAEEVGATAVAVVDRDGTPTKIMNGSAVDALPGHRRPWMTVDEVSRAIQPSMIFDADLEGEDLLTAVQRAPASEYLVTQRGRPVGVLAMVDLVARIDPVAAARMVAGQ